MNKNIFDAEGATIREVAAADIVEGTFAFTNSIAKYYSESAKTGEQVSPYVGNVSIRIQKNAPTDVYAQCANVFGDVATQKALTAGGTGKLGYAAEASPSGATHVYIRMIN